jgi:nucleoside-diphosphate-sugar epimerase
MRILVAGATGVLGQGTLPHLEGNDIIGLTRTQEKLELLRKLCAEGIVCNVHDYEALLQVTQEARPHKHPGVRSSTAARPVPRRPRRRRRT